MLSVVDQINEALGLDPLKSLVIMCLLVLKR